MNDLTGTLVSLATTTAGFATVLGIFLLIQTFIRRQSGCARDKDPLDYMPHGCGACHKTGTGTCSRGAAGRRLNRKEEEEHHHELA